MSKKFGGNIQINVERFHFSVRLESIFFPIELADLVPILEETGFSVRQELVEKIPELPIGGRIVAGGVIAEKRAIKQIFRMDPDRGVLTIVGQDINDVIEDFSKVEELVKDKLNVALEKEARFYEFIAEASASTGSDPTKVIAKLYQDSKLLPEISKIVGYSATNFGVRIVEQNRYVNDAKWFDFRIEPHVPKPNTNYHINVVYRHPERANVVQAAISLLETVEKLISAMEQGA